MSALSTAVCSITPTQRRRFFWAAWWTAAPRYAPFRKPDASNGGAASMEEALAEAERVAQRNLVLIEPYWARAWKSVLRGQTPAPPRAPEAAARQPVSRGPRQPASPWSVLGLSPGAPLSEVKRAFRKRALETHPDRGGDAEQFRAARWAYEKLLAKLLHQAQRRTPK
jgi:hypothetical protein